MHGQKLLRGWAARYNVLTTPHGTGHRTVLHEHCFADSLEHTEVIMCLDHDGSKLLGSTCDASLVVADSPTGVGFALRGDHRYARYVLDNLHRLGVRECSVHYVPQESDRVGVVEYIHRARLVHIALLTNNAPGACPATSAELFFDLDHAPRPQRFDPRFYKSYLLNVMKPPTPRRKPRPATRSKLAHLSPPKRRRATWAEEERYWNTVETCSGLTMRQLCS